MGFYDEAVHVLETIARALNGAFSYGSMADFYNRSTEKAPICPEFSKTAVRMKKHIRPPVRAEPERGLLQSKNQTDNISTRFLNSRRILSFPNLLNNTSNSRFFLILSAFFGFRPVLPILNKTIKYRISFVHGVTL